MTDIVEAEANKVGNGYAGRATLAAALLAAQAEMPAVEPDGSNPHFKSRFVTLGKLIAKVRPVLNAHGIAVAQFPTQDSEGHPTLVTVLIHESGERLQFEAPLLLPKSDPQGQGSAITYMRRYALAAALGISDQDDDDGSAGLDQPAEPVERATELEQKAAKQALGRIVDGDLDAARDIYAAALKHFDGHCPKGVAVLLTAIDAYPPDKAAA